MEKRILYKSLLIKLIAYLSSLLSPSKIRNILKKLKMKLPFDTVTALLEIYPKNMRGRQFTQQEHKDNQFTLQEQLEKFIRKNMSRGQFTTGH